MSKSPYKVVCLYSAERNAIMGNGKVYKKYTIAKFTDEELADKIAEDRSKQKQMNMEFRDKVKIGEIIVEPPNKRLLRIFAGVPNDYHGVQYNSIPEGAAHFDEPKVKIKRDITLALDSDTGNTTFILGSSKMGKSTLLMFLYNKYYRDNKYISTLFSVNTHIDLYKKHKNLLLCPEFNDKSQKLIRMEKYINEKCDNKYHFVNLFDDVIDVRFNKLINNLVLTYRNSNISSIISLQYSNLLSKCARSNINNVICFGFNTDEAIEVVINTFLKSAFRKLGLNPGEMVTFYKKMTDDHGFIYIHPASNEISFHRMSVGKLMKKR